MLKIKSILVSLLAIVALASCSNENLEENPEVEGGAGYDVAYVSISLTNPKVPGSRASGEQPAHAFMLERAKKMGMTPIR